MDNFCGSLEPERQTTSNDEHNEIQFTPISHCPILLWKFDLGLKTLLLVKLWAKVQSPMKVRDTCQAKKASLRRKREGRPTRCQVCWRVRGRFDLWTISDYRSRGRPPKNWFLVIFSSLECPIGLKKVC